MVNETLFSLINIGLSIGFILHLMFKFFHSKEHKYYLCLLLLCFSFVVNITLRLEFVDVDYTWIRISRKAVVLFFYIFMLTFLDVSKNKLVRWSLYAGVFYIIIGIISRLLTTHFSTFEIVHYYYKLVFRIVDLYLLGILFYFILHNRKGYHRYVFYGLSIVFICAFLIYYGDVLFGMNRYFSGFIVYQTEFLLAVSCFFWAILSKENEEKKEQKQLKEMFLTQKMEKEKALHLERERIAYDIHDELGAGISAIKLQTEILKQQIDTLENKKEIENLLKISDEMNHSMRGMLWSINPSNDFLDKFSEYCNNYGQNYFKNSNIKFTSEFLIEHEKKTLNAEFRHNLLLIIKELFHNCLKHSKASNVLLKIEEINGTLKIVVHDNGIGILTNNIEGYGLKSIKNRIEKLNGEFTIYNDSGTYVSLEIRMKD